MKAASSIAAKRAVPAPAPGNSLSAPEELLAAAKQATAAARAQVVGMDKEIAAMAVQVEQLEAAKLAAKNDADLFRQKAHELVSAPFGTSKNPIFAVILGVVNIAEQLISFTAKTVSHGMRLFGNMYAGELVFMLIALLGGSWAFAEDPSGSIMLMLLHVVAGFAWAVFHIIIILLQAFVFMMLTLVYIGQSHDAH